MKSFLKYLLASIAGFVISFFIVFFFFLGFIGALVSQEEKPIIIKPNSILLLKLDRVIQDRKPELPFSFAKFMQNDILGLNNILQNIEKAKEDGNIKGIYLELSHIPAGYATVDEIREALIDFKESGKFVITYCEYLTNTSYYLASVSDKIYMNPEGELFLFGLKIESLFFKKAFDKIGLEAQVIKHGEYKSAPETYTNIKMSKENKAQLDFLTQKIWDNITENITRERKITKEKINYVLDNLLLANAEDGVEYNLTDELIYKDQMISILKEKSGITEEDKLQIVDLEKYSNVFRHKKGKNRKKPKIAVIYASGGIIPGNGNDENIGAERMSRVIRNVRQDTTIRAIVFRVNSGGGSALASEVIWRELQLAQETKPIVVSFGDVAASGGYYIACPAQTIVTGKNTITGSIGVFGIILNAKELLNEHIGITSDVVKTNKYSDFASPLRALSKEEEIFLQRSIEDVYETFISHVSEGRNLSKEEVNKIGRGRVWSGISAKENGLADTYGGLNDAIKIAAGLADISEYDIRELPEIEDPFKKMFRKMIDDYEIFVLKKFLGSDYDVIKELKDIEQFNGIQAIMPYKINIY